jgi:hypothetical protein
MWSALLIRRSLKKYLKNWAQINCRLIIVKIKMKTHDLVLTGAYASTQDTTISEKDEFY